MPAHAISTSYRDYNSLPFRFSERDAKILAERQSAFLNRDTPQEGDYVRYPDGSFRRISHVWTNAENKPEWIQTSEGGSFYLGMYKDKAYMSFSGGLHCGVPVSTFAKTDELKEGHAWFFHDDFPGAGMGVDVMVDCPVWNCSEKSGV